MLMGGYKKGLLAMKLFSISEMTEDCAAKSACKATCMLTVGKGGQGSKPAKPMHNMSSQLATQENENHPFSLIF